MASFRAAETATQNNGNGIVVPIPAATQAGDLLLLVVAGEGPQAVPAGWTAVTAPADLAVEVYRRTAEVADAGATVTVSWGAAISDAAAICLAYSDVPTSSPIDVVLQQVATTSTQISIPSVTTSFNDDTVVALVAALTASATAPTIGAVSGTTQRAAVEAVSNISRSLQAQDYVQAVPGPTGAKSVTVSASAGLWAAQIAIRTVNRAPNAPTLTGPPPGAQRDLANAGVTFTAPFSDPDTGDTPSAYALRIDTGAGYEYWDEANQELSATEVKNTSTDEVHTIPAGILLNGATYPWSVKYWDAADTEGSYASDSTVIGNTPAVVTVDDLGTVTDTTRPTIGWSHTDVEGDLQQSWSVVVESGGYGTTPGSGTKVAQGSGTGTTDEWTVDVDLPNGTTFRAFVQIVAGDQLSDVGYDTFDVDIDTPDAPTVTAGWDEDTNSATVEVTGNHDTGDFPDTLYIVEYSDDQGATWQTVRGGEGVSEVDDHELPPYAERLYSARTIATVGGATVSSDRSATVGITPTPRACWITDPLDPDTKLAVKVAEFTRARSMPAATWEPVGRSTHMVTYGTVRGYVGNLVVRSWDKATYDALWALLTSRRTLLVQTMHEARYLAVTGNVDEADVLVSPGPGEPYPTGHAHTLTIPVHEVAAP